MKVRMYDCGFGDCFRLKQKSQNDLYVDFGIHSQSMTQATRCAQYDNIIAKMNQNVDFLLTHYHADHYAGAIYMSTHKHKKFTNVYIPDIWNINGSIDVVFLMLLHGLLTKSIIKRGWTLMQFLIAICRASGKIHFVKRNTNIQSDYIALWPTEKFISNRIQKEYKDVLQRDNNDRLRNIAKRLVAIVVELENSEGEEERIQEIRELEELNNEYESLVTMYSQNRNLQYWLTKLGNEISIVFQNKLTSKRKILFTGDVGGNDAWDFIEKNGDGTISMHDTYEIIKIPHHGTESYYHSFVKYTEMNTKYLIPNGHIRFHTWYVSSLYSTDINSKGCTAICSNNLACNSALTGCSCLRSSLAHNAKGYVNI